jgi:hypothetical protein
MVTPAPSTHGRVAWSPVASPFDLVDREELGDDELDFLAARTATRDVSLAGLRDRWSRLRQRLSGLSQEEVLWTDAEATVTALRIYPPPGGRAQIRYRQGQTSTGEGSLKLFGVGFGGGVAARLGTQLSFTATEAPLELVLHVRTNGARYRDARRGATLTRVDFSAGGDAMDFEIRVASGAPPDTTGGASGMPWMLEKALRLADARGSEPVEFTYPEVERKATWSVGVAVPAIAAAAGLELEARMTCESTTAYDVTFELPNGRDYGFYAPPGENVMVPYCAVLDER